MRYSYMGYYTERPQVRISRVKNKYFTVVIKRPRRKYASFSSVNRSMLRRLRKNRYRKQR